MTYFNPRKGAGIITNPQQWMGGAGYEFWLANPVADLITAAAAGNPSGLDGWGWTTTTLGTFGGGAGSLLDTNDREPVCIAFDANGDQLTSPTMFGDYVGGQIAAQFLGYTPTKLGMEAWVQWVTHTANEPDTRFGFLADAFIYSNGTNFLLRNNAGTEDAGPAVNTNWNHYKIVIDNTNMEWFYNGTSQGTVVTSANVWPNAFEAIASTTNRFRLASVRVYYE